MKKRHVPIWLLCCCLAAPAIAVTAQQERMKTCNSEATAKTLKGDERKTFMSTCLKGGTAAAPTQQEKMKTCNAKASGDSLKGDARQRFMSTCLKK
ncbi:PsiF family protein [Pseudomonas typographi]|uniref:Phosphate starvation-inducible protein PsiF n=1 Tax=Pseudomonas typographi TaxID=2715964 RepID=A0ABR7Z9D7_9PSED|nr:PsiF family protein [Pseudomonas typographi]MBD1555055.1 phosphate starvation-inducible protein PsiF [Pseudomonas typographi]MBD1590092.1 phosphate starvation-inducible protein PsiF [Pseudomonas typographi]MBD1602155.1 phosphate starvation-inducible protein PsiF [Pseudomonas typographi]